MNSQLLESRQVHTFKSTQHLHKDNNEKDPIYKSTDEKWTSSTSTINSHCSSQNLVVQTENNNVTKISAPHSLDNLQNPQISVKDNKDLPTPNSTPTTSRKSRRKSNLFTPSKKGDDRLKNGSDFGSGRAIPLKQGK